MAEAIVRIAARGDGVSEGERHVPFAVPGDRLLDDGTIEPGPHRRLPPCRHFPQCGGCQLQHADDAAYRGFLVSRIETALAQHALTTEIRDPHLSPPNSRRRAMLQALKLGQGALLGFNAEKSHRIVDMRECHILRTELFALVQPLRALCAGLLEPRQGAQAQMTLADQGVDLLLKGVEPQGLEQVEALTRFAERHRLARLSLDSGLGPEPFFEPAPATVTLSAVVVPLPAGAFLQATVEGELALVGAVLEAVGGAAATADLFAGLGTFALSLPGRVYAAEAARESAAALKRAAPAIAVEHRDLYRRPLESGELARFEAVVLDPPRAGASEQAARLADSEVRRIAYVSCNPATFARDAAALVSGGYRLEWVKPVGQFRWSTHVELAACFAR